MKPILYAKNTTDFTTNGIGRLNPTECIVGEVRNGEYEAELELPRDDKYASQIELGSIIRMKVSDGTIQAFKVYEVEKTLDDELEVKCQHISYDLSYIPVGPYTASSASDAISGVKTHSLITNPFSFHTDIVSGVTFNQTAPASARAFLGGIEGSLLDIYNGEYKFDNLDVYLYNHRGNDNGVTIRWGKNITKLEDEVNNENAVDGLVPYWTDGSYTVLGDVLTVTGSAGKRIVVEDVSGDIQLEEGETTPAKSKVNAAGQVALAKKVTQAEETIKVEYYQNPEIANVQLCDYVTVIYEPYNVNVKLKVVSTTWDVLAEKYIEVELGEYKSFAQTITSMSAAIDNVYYNNGILTIRLERTEDGLLSEVTRAMGAEGDLGTAIVQTAEEIIQTAAASVTEYDETGVVVNYYGYGAPDSTQYPPSDNSGKVYLDRATGYYYTCNGYSWIKSAEPLPEVKTQLAAQIELTATGIVQRVAGTYNQYIIPRNEAYLPTGETIAIRADGSINEQTYNPDFYRGYCYLDEISGEVYRSTYNYGVYKWTYITTLPTIYIEYYDIGDPSTDVHNPSPSGQHYLDEGSGYLWVSDGTGWSRDNSAYTNPLHSQMANVQGELSLRIRNDDGGQGLISVIEGAADYINFDAKRMFTVHAPNLNIEHDGIVRAIGFEAENTIEFLDQFNNSLGYMGKTHTASGAEALGIRNSTDSAAIVAGTASNGWLWIKGGGVTTVLTDDVFEPWVDGSLSLGYNAYGIQRRWNTIYLVNEPWQASSDRRMKNEKGDLKDFKKFYMQLRPIRYKFKDGLNENPDNMNYGLMAQEVLESYKKCYNDDKQGIVLTQDADQPTRDVIGDDKKYVINYDEFHAFHIAMIQDLQAQISDLKSEIESLRKEIKK